MSEDSNVTTSFEKNHKNVKIILVSELRYGHG